MAKQSLLWTTLPNGYSDDGKSLRVSVLLSPRLDAEGDPQQLGTFGDFVDWPVLLALMSHNLSDLRRVNLSGRDIRVSAGYRTLVLW